MHPTRFHAGGERIVVSDLIHNLPGAVHCNPCLQASRAAVVIGYTVDHHSRSEVLFNASASARLRQDFQRFIHTLLRQWKFVCLCVGPFPLPDGKGETCLTGKKAEGGGGSRGGGGGADKKREGRAQQQSGEHKTQR